VERVFLVDELTGKKKRGPSLAGLTGGFTDEDFDIIAPTNFLPLTEDITLTQKIDIWVNGVLLREGSSYSWERNIDDNEINFNSTIPENAWVRVRVFAE
jgi:hypothetical protein